VTAKQGADREQYAWCLDSWRLRPSVDRLPDQGSWRV